MVVMPLPPCLPSLSPFMIQRAFAQQRSGPAGRGKRTGGGEGEEVWGGRDNNPRQGPVKNPGSVLLMEGAGCPSSNSHEKSGEPSRGKGRRSGIEPCWGHVGPC